VSRRAFQPVKPREITSPKHAVGELFEQNGGLKHVMVKLAIGKTTAYAFTDPQAPDEISFARVSALTGPEATAAASYLALLAGGVFLPVAPEDADVSTLCADDLRAHGEAVACLVDGLRDGKLTNGEAKKALEKILGALRTLAGLYAVVTQGVKNTSS
jgi:hypothetical protein